MVFDVSGITTGIIKYALDGLTLRHAAIASNIANVNSEGYQSIQVSFEKELLDLAGQKNNFAKTSIDTLSPPVLTAAPSYTTQSQGDTLEFEMVALNQNALQYQALITGLGKYTSVISTAINEGKR